MLTFPLMALVLGHVSKAQADDWPRFRGPTGQGETPETGLPIRWSETDNVTWKTPINGSGWSSPVVHSGRVFVTSTTDEGRTCHVHCVDAESGALLWDKVVCEQEPKHKRLQNSHATPTPVTDGETVFAVFSAGRVVALDYQGEERWNVQAVDFYSQHGLGASPILYGDMLIMPFDGSSPGDDAKVGFKKPWDGAVLMAFNKNTGKVLWRGSRGMSRLGHVTPQIIEQGGAVRMVSAAGDVVQGHDPASGELVWSIYSQGEGVTPSIVRGPEGVVFTCSGFEEPTIRAVRLGGEGTVTDSHVVWEQRKGVPALSSLVYVAPHVFSVTDAGIIHCFEAATGELVWKKRIGGKHSASPIVAEGRIYTLSETDGETVVIEPGDEYREIARNQIGELCKASIAVADGSFYIRGEHSLFRIDAPE
ncbi:outer membrane protein assembly factor BamB family protein [Pseudobythopirellula maris]|uniref:outer membrane protein assembly factor BamB family protein n=1 Tax=Pseudobythopirellula maris TaxID=2527991 RepID=UPI0018D3B324|nr:PQQ-binding-like beta-propeller repeat protein [Pseudobythopirellula maris]